MALLESLFVKLGYEVDQDQIDAFNESVNTSARTLQKVALAGFGAASALVYFTKKMADVNNQQKQIANSLGLPLEISTAWRDAAEDMGLSADDATAALSSIATVQENLASGVPPSPEFLRGLAQIGLTIDDIQNADPGEALLKINKGLQGLEGTAQRGATSLLGLRDQFNLVSDPNLGQRVKENLTAPFDRSGLDAFTKQWSDFTQMMRDSWLKFANELAPTIGAALTVVGEHLSRILGDLSGFLVDVFTAPAKALDAFTNFTKDTILGDAQRLTVDALEGRDKLIGNVLDFFSGDDGGGALATTAGGGASSSSANNSKTVNNEVTVNVVTDNPEAAAQATRRVLEHQNNAALGNFASPRVN